MYVCTIFVSDGVSIVIAAVPLKQWSILGWSHLKAMFTNYTENPYDNFLLKFNNRKISPNKVVRSA